MGVIPPGGLPCAQPPLEGVQAPDGAAARQEQEQVRQYQQTLDAPTLEEKQEGGGVEQEGGGVYEGQKNQST